MTAPGDKLKVLVYDDHAYAVIPGESKCKIGDGAEATLGMVNLKLSLDYLKRNKSQHIIAVQLSIIKSIYPRLQGFMIVNWGISEVYQLACKRAATFLKVLLYFRML